MSVCMSVAMHACMHVYVYRLTILRGCVVLVFRVHSVRLAPAGSPDATAKNGNICNIYILTYIHTYMHAYIHVYIHTSG